MFIRRKLIQNVNIITTTCRTERSFYMLTKVEGRQDGKKELKLLNVKRTGYRL